MDKSQNILDQDGRILGKSGLIKQEQYVKFVTLKQPITKIQKVVLKNMLYEPDTYMSAGSITLTITIQVNEN